MDFCVKVMAATYAKRMINEDTKMFALKRENIERIKQRKQSAGHDAKDEIARRIQFANRLTR